MSSAPKPLYNPSDGRDFAAWGGFGTPIQEQTILDSEGPCPEWRMVEIFTTKGPFLARLSWSAGGGTGDSVNVVMVGAGRIVLFCRSLRIVAGNLTALAQRITATTAELSTCVTTNNQWYEELQADVNGNPVQGSVPRHARGFRVEYPGGAAQAAASTITVQDGNNAAIASYLGSAQLQWNPIGDALGVRVTLAANARCRIVYELHL